MGLKGQGAKPTGKTGKFIGRMMNSYHTRFYRVFYNGMKLPEGGRILDAGCGGGGFIQFLARTHPDLRLYGIDHSPEMIALAEKVNREAVQSGRVFLAEGSVTALPHQEGTMDLVTANETVQFWPGISRSFSEMHRVLKKGGRFIIINRYPSEGSRWWDSARLKNENEYRQALTEAGFEKAETDLETKKGWIIACAMK